MCSRSAIDPSVQTSRPMEYAAAAHSRPRSATIQYRLMSDQSPVRDIVRRPLVGSGNRLRVVEQARLVLPETVVTVLHERPDITKTEAIPSIASVSDSVTRRFPPWPCRPSCAACEGGGLDREAERPVLHPHRHFAAVTSLAEQQFLGERLLDLFLDQTAHRARAVELVVAPSRSASSSPHRRG